MNITIDFDLTDEQVKYILTDAIETDALAYYDWLAKDIKRNKEILVTSFVLEVKNENNIITEYLVNRETVEKGINKLFEDGFNIRKDILQSISDDNIDAEGTNCIIQAGIFGKIVYG